MVSKRLNNFVVVGGGGGRESVLLWRAAQAGLNCFALVKVANPSVKEYCGERVLVGGFNVDNLKLLLEQLSQDSSAGPDSETVFWVSSDEALECGVVDELRKLGVPASRIIGPTRSAARIETDKIYSIKLVQKLFPEITPRHWVASNGEQIALAVSEAQAEGRRLVVKPVGLTGGKGVKVMDAHLPDFSAVVEYAEECLGSDGRVLLVEKIAGIEISIMGLTDGKFVIGAPATYDHPYRFDGDRGPGTGGMGSFTGPEGQLPFVSRDSYEQCLKVMKGVVQELGSLGEHFTGVLYGGFFLTAEGPKFLEFNARFGDPEAMNISTLMECDFRELLLGLAEGTLSECQLTFSKLASVVKYLVHPDYCLKPAQPIGFDLDVEKLRGSGVEIFFASAESNDDDQGDRFKTVGGSRTVALVSCAETISEAASKINSVIDNDVQGELQFRRDIGMAEQLEGLVELGDRFGSHLQIALL